MKQWWNKIIYNNNFTLFLNQTLNIPVFATSLIQKGLNIGKKMNLQILTSQSVTIIVMVNNLARHSS